MQHQVTIQESEHGLSVPLPAELVSRLALKAGDVVQFSGASSEARLVIEVSRAEASPNASKQLELAEDIMKRYDDTLRELAK